MRSHTKRHWLAVFALLMAVGACRTPPVPPPAAPETSPGQRPAATAEPAGAESLAAEGFDEPVVAGEPLGEATGAAEGEEALDVEANLATVYFEFDSSALGPEARRVLEDNARWLIDHPDVRIVIEGHCDERGTVEYNLALGARRAQAVRDYLVNLGVAADRIRTVSYGEERPAAPGHDEASWSRNRRAEFKGER